MIKKLSLVFLLLLLNAACTDKQFAQSLNDFSSALLLFEKTEIALHSARLVDDATHKQIQVYVSKLAISGKQVVLVTKSRQDTKAVVVAMITAVDELLVQGIIPIKDESVRNRLHVIGVAMKLPLSIMLSKVN